MKDKGNNCNAVDRGPPRTTWPPAWLQNPPNAGASGPHHDPSGPVVAAPPDVVDNDAPPSLYPSHGQDDAPDDQPPEAGKQQSTAAHGNRPMGSTVFVLLPGGDITRCAPTAIPPEAV